MAKKMLVADKKFHKVMREFKEGKLYSGDKKVTDRKQAIAIAFSEARKLNSKKYHLTAENGMLLRGPSHEDGGIAGIIKESGQRIEVEGDEMIINKRSTRIKDHIVCRGTGEGIGSALNELGGGKKWSSEGTCEVTEEIEQFKDGNKMNKGSKELLEKIKAGDKITENEVNLIKNRLNQGRQDEYDKEIVQYIWDNHAPLTEDQEQKGLDYLKKLWKTPTGKEKSSNPFGSREESMIENFSRFDVIGFHDIARYGQKSFHVPLYALVDKDGDSFEYYVDSTGINIVGAKGMKIEKEEEEEEDKLYFVDPSDVQHLIRDIEVEIYAYDLRDSSDFLLNDKSEKEIQHAIDSGDFRFFSEDKITGYMHEKYAAKGKKISSHINKRKNESLRNIQRMIIRDGKLKKAEQGELVKINREDKLIKINRPQDFAIVSFLKHGSYPTELKVFKYGDSICIYKNDPELIEFLNKYKIAYSEFDNYEEFYEWLTSKLTATTKSKL